MVFKKRYLIVPLAVIGSLLVLEVIARFLASPNHINPGGNPSFLLKTTWHQVGNYARFIPYDNDAGCWATAIAQIGHFHRLNPSGMIRYKTSKGKDVEVDLDSCTFRHDHFPILIEKNTPEEAVEQVAKYTYFIAALIYTDFGSHGYLEHETFISRLETHLSCSVTMHQYQKDAYLQRREEIKNIVLEEIDAARPLLFYFDNGKDFGHAAALDGYIETDEAFYVHLNMGWDGRSDGWFDLFHRIMGVRDDMQNRFLITIKPSEH